MTSKNFVNDSKKDFTKHNTQPYSHMLYMLLRLRMKHFGEDFHGKFICSQNFCQKSPQSRRQFLGILDVKTEFESQVSHQNKTRKVFLRQFPLSKFLIITLRVNIIAMKSFLKIVSFGIDFKLKVPPLQYKMNTHKISGVRKQPNNPD